MTDAAVEVTDVFAGYGETDALAGVSLRVAPGELCAVLGPNGAGKSTLVKLLSGILRARRGSVAIVGKDVRRSIAAPSLGSSLSSLST